MNYKSKTELKNIARDKMLGNYGTAIGAFLFMRTVLYFAMLILGQLSTNIYTEYAILFVLGLVEGLFIFGEQAIYLKISVGMDTKVNEVCSAFSKSTKKAILARLYYLLLIYGWGIISYAGVIVCENYLGSARDLSRDVLFIVVAVGMIYQLISYSQVVLLLHDFGSLTVTQAYAKSRQLMKGRKLALFKIYISFIPMYIVGILSMGVGLFFIHPYYKMTLTEFYLDCVRTGGVNITQD